MPMCSVYSWRGKLVSITPSSHCESKYTPLIMCPNVMIPVHSDGGTTNTRCQFSLSAILENMAAARLLDITKMNSSSLPGLVLQTPPKFSATSRTKWGNRQFSDSTVEGTFARRLLQSTTSGHRPRLAHYRVRSACPCLDCVLHVFSATLLSLGPHSVARSSSIQAVPAATASSYSCRSPTRLLVGYRPPPRFQRCGPSLYPAWSEFQVTEVLT